MDETELSEDLLREVRLHVFRQSAETAHVPQAPDIAKALGRQIDWNLRD